MADDTTPKPSGIPPQLWYYLIAIAVSLVVGFAAKWGVTPTPIPLPPALTEEQATMLKEVHNKMSVQDVNCKCGPNCPCKK